MRIAYLIGRYPVVSHTFIMREIQALRQLGVGVDTFSIWRTPPSQLLSEAEREEDRRTEALLPLRLPRMLRAHASALARQPVAYVRALRRALRLSRPGLWGRLLGLSWFVEAVLLLEGCRRRGLRHLHVHLGGTGPAVALLTTYLGNGGRREGSEWTWSMTVHGPSEFYEVSRERLDEKVLSASFVVSVSDFTRSQLMLFLEEDHWPNLALVRCGVDPQQFRPQEAAAGAPEGGNGPVRVLAVGRLVGGKGFALLLDALHALVQRGRDVALTLVGDGPSRERLHAQAARLGLADRVEWVGALGQDEIRERYARADVFCLPSFAEGVPVVLMEAMAMAVPVVATRIAGIPELVEDGASGLLVTPGRADELADALGALVDDAGLRARLGAAGREAVRDGYDLRSGTSALRMLFEAAAGHST